MIATRYHYGSRISLVEATPLVSRDDVPFTLRNRNKPFMEEGDLNNESKFTPIPFSGRLAYVLGTVFLGPQLVFLSILGGAMITKFRRVIDAISDVMPAIPKINCYLLVVSSFGDDNPSLFICAPFKIITPLYNVLSALTLMIRYTRSGHTGVGGLT